MNRKRAAALSLTTAALMMGGGGVAHADGPSFENNAQILSCLTLEVLDIPIASAANNNIDCSKNHHVEQYEYNFQKTIRH